MAELCILVRDKENPADPDQDEELLKRGDVVEILPDGADWGRKTLADPSFRILRLPGVPVDRLLKWLEREQYTAADALLPPWEWPSLGQRVRRINLDAALLPAALKAWLADDTRTLPVRKIATGGEALLNATERAVPRLRDRIAGRRGLRG